MAQLEITSGDLPTGTANYAGGEFIVDSKKKKGEKEYIPAKKLKSLDILNKRKDPRFGRALVMGGAGAALFGPVGLAGALFAGSEKHVTFTGKFKDGKRFTAKTSFDTFKKIRREAGLI